jgi:hypothetical protein
MGNGGSFPAVKRPGREADHSPPSSAEIKNAWRYTSNHQYVFMTWCLVKHRDNFTFTCYFHSHVSELFHILKEFISRESVTILSCILLARHNHSLCFLSVYFSFSTIPVNLFCRLHVPSITTIFRCLGRSKESVKFQDPVSLL